MISEQLVHGFAGVVLSPDPDLAVAALMIARVAYPRLEAGPYLEQLDDLGREAARRIASRFVPVTDIPDGVDPRQYARVTVLNELLFTEEHFVGNDAHYEDPRNSYLNEVLDRRMGIPITLALVYKEVARRAGVVVEGVNFPGHFLLRCPAEPGSPFSRDLIIDAHHGGALLTEGMCQALLHKHGGEEASWNPRLLCRATKPQILTRILHNLKRSYVRMHSLPQAREITELLLAADPTSITEFRDRGLIAYHLNDFGAALRDLQHYLTVSSKGDLDQEERDEQEQIWEHVKSLRRRVASFN